jgi:hypothetical protein
MPQAKTLFTLEAVFAKKGDALILHYGAWENPHRVLIDGGPRGVYKSFLKPRLQQLREEAELEESDSLPFRMVMVSHVDDDHIAGIIDLFNDQLDAKAKKKPLPYKVDTLWHNSFDDIAGSLNDNKEVLTRMAASAASSGGPGLPLPKAMSRESKAVVASTAQGRMLRNAAKKLAVEVNSPFQGLVMFPAPKKVSLGSGLALTVIGPDEERVREFQRRWNEDLLSILAKETESANAASFSDDSPFNLASICVLAKMKGRQMLLTGDARGDFILSGLEKAKLLHKTKPLHIDLLKVPHHGSDRNVEDSFFERVTADSYVISGDGEHGNPEVDTLKMIARARGAAKYAIHFTFTKDAHVKEKNKKRKAALRAVMDWVKEKPPNCSVVFRDAADENNSILIDLLDPYFE